MANIFCNEQIICSLLTKRVKALPQNNFFYLQLNSQSCLIQYLSIKIFSFVFIPVLLIYCICVDRLERNATLR